MDEFEAPGGETSSIAAYEIRARMYQVNEDSDDSESNDNGMTDAWLKHYVTAQLLLGNPIGIDRKHRFLPRLKVSNLKAHREQ